MQKFANKKISWNEDKNKWLIKNRGLSFEDVLVAIEQDKIIDIIRHPNKEKYPKQKILIIEIQGYVCAVPYVVDENEIFLKTIYKSRKLNKAYGKEK